MTSRRIARFRTYHNEKDCRDCCCGHEEDEILQPSIRGRFGRSENLQWRSLASGAARKRRRIDVERWAKLDISITVKLRIQAHERCPLQEPNGRNKELLYPLTAASCQRLTLGRLYSARLAALVCNNIRREAKKC